jgi:hypothetical protein
MKRFVTILILTIFLCFNVSLVTFAEEPFKIILNNRITISNMRPKLINNKLYIPAEFLTTYLGAEIKYNEGYKKVYININGFLTEIPTATLNTKQIEIVGSQDFKDNIISALNLLKDKSPSDYEFVTHNIIKIESKEILSKDIASMETSGDGIVYCNWDYFNKITDIFDNEKKHIILAGCLVHESYHIYMDKKGIIMPVIEEEVLAFTKKRQFYNNIKAPKIVFSTIDIDNIIDTDYYDTIEK